MSATAMTEEFLGHIFSGEMEAARTMIAPSAAFIGSRPEATEANPLFGTFKGPNGATEFFEIFGKVIEPGAFSIEGKFGTADSACLFGKLDHKVRATGKPFKSDWALITKFEGGKMTLYHFYEDTAALAEAMAN